MSRFQEFRASAEQEAYVAGLFENSPYFQNKTTRDTSTREAFYGYLGETVIADLLGAPRPNFDGDDGGVDIDYYGHNVDVKVQSSKTVPRESHDVKVIADQLTVSFENDWLLFLLYNQEKRVFYFAGMIKKWDFLKQAVLVHDGSVLYGGSYVVKGDQYFLPISETKEMRIPI